LKAVRGGGELTVLHKLVRSGTGTGSVIIGGGVVKLASAIAVCSVFNPADTFGSAGPRLNWAPG
jgi:hypothetical protein